MHEIFISYSSKHRDLTRELAAVLEAQYGEGSVWWDQELEARGAYDEQIEAALDAARVVVVVWTTDAAVSRWVKSEAARAQRQAKLVNVRPSGVSGGDLPMPFNLHQVERLEDRVRILAVVAKTWRGEPIPTADPLDLLYEYEHDRRLIDPKQERLPQEPLDIAPSDLLRAQHALVPYDDAAGMAAELLGWCTAGPRPVTGRPIHGPGGLGKSRLLIHVAAKLRGQGWTAGFLDRPHTQDEAVHRQRRQAIEQRVRHGEDRGLLLVLDYAETRQDELIELAACLAGTSGNEARPVRLVLLARSAGEWWDRLSKEKQEVHRVFRGRGLRPEITLLPSLPATRQRRALFEAACAAFAPTLQAQGYVPPPGGPAPERLRGIDSNDDYERPLAIQIEALLWLTSATTDANLLSFPELLDNMLVLEQAHWRSLPGTVADTAMARGLGQVTLVQGVDTRPAAEQLLLADRFDDKRTSRADVDPLFRRLRQLYGRATDGIAQLEPDLIGEHHVASKHVGDAELLAGCLAWIAAQPQEDRPQRRRDLLTVLQRATHRVHGVATIRRAEAMLDIIIAQHVDTFAAELVGVMVDTPGNLTQLVDRWIDKLDEDTLTAIGAVLPPVSLSLMDLSFRVANRLAAAARTAAVAVDDNPHARIELREKVRSDLAAGVGTLGIRLLALGRQREALTVSLEAVDLYRQLAAAQPDAFLMNFAASLYNTGAILSDLGRWEEALAPRGDGAIPPARGCRARDLSR